VHEGTKAASAIRSHGTHTHKRMIGQRRIDPEEGARVHRSCSGASVTSFDTEESR
jgi:hypothetical protein